MDVVGTACGRLQQAGAHRVETELVDQDEAAGLAILRVDIEGHRAVESHIAEADLVEFELLRRLLLQRVDVDLVLRRSQRGIDRARADLQQVLPVGQHGLLVHPDQRGFELVGHAGGHRGGGQQIAARDINFTVQRERDGLSGLRAGQVAILGHDARNDCFLARGQGAHLVAHGDGAAGDLAGEATEIHVGAVHPLHRQAERRVHHAVFHPARIPDAPSASGRDTRACARCGW